MKKLLPLLCLLALPVWSADIKPIYKLEAKEYNENANFCCFIDWGTSGWFNQSLKFPDAEVLSLKTNKKVRISDLVKNKPVVIEMGSMTCPSYDLNLSRMRALHAKYKDQVDFYTLYVRENHPNQMYPAHSDMKQKIASAATLQKEDAIDHTVLVDDVNGSYHQVLGNYGNAVYLVGRDMRSNHWSVFAHPAYLEQGIQELLKAKGIAAKAKFVGGTDVHPLAQSVYSLED